MKTIAPEAPTSHTSARWRASTPGAARAAAFISPAVAAYAITRSYVYATHTPTNTARCPPSRCTTEDHNSISVFVLGQQRDRRLQQNHEIEQHRPVLDVIEVKLDAFLDLLFVVDLAAPAVDLGPAGDAGLDPVAGEIAVDGFVEQAALQLALHRMRTRADQREIAGEDHVEELRQLVGAGLADEAANPGDARVVLGHDLRGRRIRLMMVHRAELVDVDALIVEAEALLAEQHGAGAVELHGQRHQSHHRQGHEEREGADHAVEQPFHHQVPVGDRRLEHVQRRHLADIGIGAGAEAQLVGVCGEADVHRQHPELLQHLQDARLGGDRQREQHEIDAGAAGEFDDVVDLAELARAGTGVERAAVVAVVEHAEHVDVGIFLLLQRLDQLFAVAVGADDDGAAVESTLAPPGAHQRAQHQTLAEERGEPEDVEGGKPQPRNFAAELGEEGDADEQQEDERPGRDHPRHLPELAAEQLHLIDVGSLEADHGGNRDGDDLRGIDPAEGAGVRHDIAEIEDDADEAQQREIGEAYEAGDHDR